MCQSNRLCFLHMCKSRHKSIYVIIHDPKDRLLKIIEFIIYIKNLVANIHLHIKCDLIVAASAGMKFLSRIAYSLYQFSFNKTVNIFTFISDHKLTSFNIRKYAAQAVYHVGRFFLCDDTAVTKHLRLRDATTYILSV